MDGHEGQHVVVVPSRRIVIVRLGCTKNGGFDLRALVRATLTAQR
jgi:CubicO group peptidase (beta-lactamase class C family)